MLRAVNFLSLSAVILLFGAEGVVTAAQSGHVQAGCRAASLLNGIMQLEEITVELYAVYLDFRYLSNDFTFNFTSGQQQVHSVSKDGTQLDQWPPTFFA